MRKRLFFGLLMLMCCVAPTVAQQYLYTNSGMQFRFFHDEPGENAKIGELVSLDMLVKNDKGATIRSTYSEGKSILFPIKYSVFEGDIYEAVSTLSEGDSAEFLISADSMYAKVFRKPMPSNVAKGSLLSFTIASHKIYSQQEYFAMQEEKQKVYEESHKGEIEARFQQESVQLKKYFEDNFPEYHTSTSGVFYSVVSEGKGEVPVSGESVVFDYIGLFINGEEFENSKDPGMTPMSFGIGNNDVIPGLEEAFKQLKVGTRAVIGIPSHLAYGRKGKGKVPANTIVLFEVYFFAKN